MVAAAPEGVERASGNGSCGSRLEAVRDLLGEQIAAIRDAPVERDGRVIGAAAALLLGPIGEAGHQANELHQDVVSADGANLVVVVAALRAEANKLNQAVEIVGSDIVGGDAGDFTDTRGELDFARRGEDRPAPGDDKLKQGNQGGDTNQGRNHRAASPPVDRRASSETFVKV